VAILRINYNLVISTFQLDDMARIEQDAHGEHFSKVFFYRHYYTMDLVVSISQKSSIQWLYIVNIVGH
jgi:hypothetical protein